MRVCVYVCVCVGAVGCRGVYGGVCTGGCARGVCACRVVRVRVCVCCVCVYVCGEGSAVHAQVY